MRSNQYYNWIKHWWIIMVWLLRLGPTNDVDIYEIHYYIKKKGKKISVQRGKLEISCFPTYLLEMQGTKGKKGKSRFPLHMLCTVQCSICLGLLRHQTPFFFTFDFLGLDDYFQQSMLMYLKTVPSYNSRVCFPLVLG